MFNRNCGSGKWQIVSYTPRESFSELLKNKSEIIRTLGKGEYTEFQKRAYSIFDQSTSVVLLGQMCGFGKATPGFDEANVDYVLNMAFWLKDLHDYGKANPLACFHKTDFDLIESLLGEANSIIEDFSYNGIAIQRTVEKINGLIARHYGSRAPGLKLDYSSLFRLGLLSLEEITNILEVDLAKITYKIRATDTENSIEDYYGVPNVRKSLDDLVVLSIFTN